jgi:tRNA pseudouridine55 synthase
MSLTLRIVCSKGTYIRAFARDFGEALNSGAHLTALRRTRVGRYTLADARKLDDLLAEINETTCL